MKKNIDKSTIISEYISIYNIYQQLIKHYNISWTYKPMNLYKPEYLNKYKEIYIEKYIDKVKHSLYTIMNDILIFKQTNK